jgi:hypothetical protein
LRPTLVAEVAEDDPTDRPRHEPDRVRAERQQRAHERLEVREEELVEDQGGGHPEQEEVVPLDGGTDQAGDDDLARRRAARLRVHDGAPSPLRLQRPTTCTLAS